MTLVRRAVAGEADAVAQVWRAGLAAAGARPAPARTAELAARLAAPGGVLVVALADSEVVGGALGEWEGDGVLRLVLLEVHPARRRTGIGGALAEGLADAAWPHGARQLVARPASGPGRSFLLSCGLEPDGDELVGELVGELEPPVRKLVVRPGGLRLGQLLKLAGLVDTGAEGKALLAAGGVTVGGEVELRRGRQLVDGDVVVALDQAVRVALSGPGPGPDSG